MKIELTPGEIEKRVDSIMPKAIKDQLAGLDQSSPQSKDWSAADVRLVLEIFPQLAGKKDPSSRIQLWDLKEKVHSWRIKEFSEWHKDNIAMLEVATKSSLKYVAMKAELEEAEKRVGLANEEKMNAQKAANAAEIRLREIEANTVQLAAGAKAAATARFAGVEATLRGQIELIRSQEAEIIALKTRDREALAHSKAALEHLQDRYPTPPPFLGMIMGEIQAGVRMLMA